MRTLLFYITLLSAFTTWSQPANGSLDVQWIHGAEDCTATTQESLQVHQYAPQTYILRQNPCVSFEANFLYLLIGSERALLIDSGAVADPSIMPLAETVLNLIPNDQGDRLPLIVGHTHGHSDHRAGDVLFSGERGVEIVPVDLPGVQAFFDLENWPRETAEFDLGGRIIDIVPTPGHHATDLSFYDRRTTALFTGDVLLPGRLYIQDTETYHASTVRLRDFVESRPVAHILGGHIELDLDGNLYTRGADYHPDERPLALDKNALMTLPTAVEDFNGLYTTRPTYVLTNPERMLIAMGSGALIALLLVLWVLYRTVRWLRARSTGTKID